MKTISDYTIYCTPEQTKKALELGALIRLESEYYHPTENDFKLDKPIPCKSFTMGYHYAKCPTAEQMLGWLENQGTIKVISIHNSKNLDWSFHITTKNNEVFASVGYKTRMEATFAAIDAALEYLSKNK